MYHHKIISKEIRNNQHDMLVNSVKHVWCVCNISKSLNSGLPVRHFAIQNELTYVMSALPCWCFLRSDVSRIDIQPCLSTFKHRPNSRHFTEKSIFTWIFLKNIFWVQNIFEFKKFFWNRFLRSNWQYDSIGTDSLVPNRWQAIIRSNDTRTQWVQRIQDNSSCKVVQ